MLPIAVDLSRVPVLLIGGGERARRRLRLLDEAGAGALVVHAPDADEALAAAAGARLRRRLPSAAEIARARLLFVAGAAAPVAAEICRVAQIAGVLANVEDDRAHCDFHAPAVMRRGDLTIAVSTDGRSPGLAAWLRGRIEEAFGAEWGERLDEIAALRRAWRRSGADPATIGRLTARWADARCRSEPHPSNSNPPSHAAPAPIP